jgi:CDP-4-dehydro-6-deoxyglucose reductase
MVLYWGARTRADLYCLELAERWQTEYPDMFRYVAVLSEATEQDAWTGRTGFVHQAVLDDFADLSAYQVYACGAPVMVEAAHRAFITERQLPEAEFFSDAFFLAKDMQSR